MEMNEFKLLWNKNLAGDSGNSARKNEADLILTATFNNLQPLIRAGKFWWKAALAGIVLLTLLTVGTAILFFLYPEQLQSLGNATLVIITLAVFILLTGWLYYRQANILKFSDGAPLMNALRQAIHRFTRWYRLSFVVFLIVLWPVYYFLTAAVFYQADTAVSLPLHLFLSIALTLITLLLNHVHYKRNYFRWLSRMKQNLAELKEEQVPDR